MDHLQAIRIFARVVETGGFGRAALSLNMPNATVSKWIRSLEEHLGVRLLERNTRTVSVTTDGAAYYERTRHLLMELDDIEATLGRSQGSPKGALRVDAGGSTASGIIIPQLPVFCERYPDIQVQLSVTDRTLDLIAANIDCGIRSSASDPAKHGVPEHPHQIVERGMPVVGYFSANTGLPQPLEFHRDGEKLVLENTRNNVMVSESNAHLATALNGLGLIHTMDFMVRPFIEKGLLVPVLMSWRPEPLTVYVAYPPSRRFSTKVRVFVDWVANVFQETH
jgi:DNA-binding transcriptional LysR family regulator